MSQYANSLLQIWSNQYFASPLVAQTCIPSRYTLWWMMQLRLSPTPRQWKSFPWIILSGFARSLQKSCLSRKVYNCENCLLNETYISCQGFWEPSLFTKLYRKLIHGWASCKRRHIWLVYQTNNLRMRQLRGDKLDCYPHYMVLVTPIIDHWVTYPYTATWCPNLICCW